MMAAIRGYADIINLLVDHGANLDAQNKVVSPVCLLVCSVVLGIANVTRYSTKQIGATALMLAANRGHNEVIRILLEAGANVHIKDMVRESPMSVYYMYCSILHRIV